jgi:phosphoglycerate kinase
LIHQLKYDKEIGHARELLDRYRERIIVPDWVAVREGNRRVEFPVSAIPGDAPVLDLGMDAISTLSKQLKSAGTVVFNGPAGVFEEPDFATGTYELLKAASQVDFSVVGGGHTAAVIEKLGLSKHFTHISTGGGACIEFLTGKKLPAVEALEMSKKIFN